MNSKEDLFDCRVSQFYESLPLKEVISDQDGADQFFDVNSTPPRNQEDASPPEEFFTPLPVPNANDRVKKGFLSPVVEDPEPEPDQQTDEPNDRRNSCGNLPQGRVILKAKRRSWQIPKKNQRSSTKEEIDHLAKAVFDGIQLDPVAKEKEHAMTTRQDVAVKTPTLSLRNRSVVRLQMKRSRVYSPSHKGPPVKFIALAEQVQHFFMDTPPRFRTSPRHKKGEGEVHPKDPVQRLIATIPQSPHLLTKERARSPSPPREESHLVKAYPLNPKIFQPPDASAKPQPKPTTVPKPFNLTTYPKKDVPLSKETQELIQFKARPVPRSCRSSISSVASSTASRGQRRVPVTLEVRGEDGQVESSVENSHMGVFFGERNNLRKTVQPFSFDVRDRIARKKKEEKIQQIIAEETMIPQFKAKPVPSFVSHSTANEEADQTTSSRTSRMSKAHHCEDVTQKAHFKAKPPTVLFKEPFKPKKIEKPLTEIAEFRLNSERRAKERALFEQARKEKENQMEQLKKAINAEVNQLEKKEIQQLRKSMVPKANPLPPFIAAPKNTDIN